ncbi:MAG: hypothetical protein QOD11_898 [Bradyrhizobium sp.]|jgi:hypothetical protein|nr:hypothetical protein [Bradyrhizobium sp.]
MSFFRRIRTLFRGNAAQLPAAEEQFLRVSGYAKPLVLNEDHDPRRTWFTQNGLVAQYDSSDDRNVIPFWMFGHLSKQSARIEGVVRCSVIKPVSSEQVLSLIPNVAFSGTDLSPWLWDKIWKQPTGQRGLLATDKGNSGRPRSNLFLARTPYRNRPPDYLGGGSSEYVLVRVTWERDLRSWCVVSDELRGLDVGGWFFFPAKKEASL